MPEEISGISEELSPALEPIERGRRVYHRGNLFGKDVVLAFTRCGKVAAATTATQMIIEHGVSEVIFTGVAGAADRELNIGDIVIATTLYQHDMDASPIFPRHEIPLLGVDRFHAGVLYRETAVEAARHFLSEEFHQTIPAEIIRQFGLTSPKVVQGEVASGDKFFASREDLRKLRRRWPEVACVEMEGAAVAQVCYEYDVPLTVVRTISDSANEHSHIDFPKFITAVAAKYSRGILKNILERKR